MIFSQLPFEDLLKVVARKLDMAIDANHLEQSSWHFERVLRESGLLRLLEAGQAMRGVIEMECSGEDPDGCDKQWDAALAAMKEKLK